MIPGTFSDRVTKKTCKLFQDNLTQEQIGYCQTENTYGF